MESLRNKKEKNNMKKVYKLQDLDCANCAAKMEAGIKKLDGVKDANVNFIMQKMTVEFEEGADAASVMAEVKKTCKRIEPDCEILGL